MHAVCVVSCNPSLWSDQCSRWEYGKRHPEALWASTMRGGRCQLHKHMLGRQHGSVLQDQGALQGVGLEQGCDEAALALLAAGWDAPLLK